MNTEPGCHQMTSFLQFTVHTPEGIELHCEASLSGPRDRRTLTLGEDAATRRAVESLGEGTVLEAAYDALYAAEGFHDEPSPRPATRVPRTPIRLRDRRSRRSRDALPVEVN
ncbi:MAG TPA: hypothetical protein VKY73_09980 [Polyangiaceae bacterium]|nr:hypothetical protein [Polyangiaceae bacterium]